jgi:hypothetical protein
MRVPFRQGIIRYPYSGSIQQFLQINGSYINLTAVNGPTEATIAHGNANYLHIENADVDDAWGPFTASTDQWLYWDIDLSTGARTFGITLVEPIFNATEPVSPVADLHWFDTTNNVIKNYQSGSFTEVARVFAAKFDGVVTFTSLSAGLPNLPFAGSQVGLTNSSNLSGRIIFDDSGKSIIRATRELFTTEDQFFASGSRINSIRLESNSHTAIASTQLAAFDIVKYVTGGKILPAGYNDTGSTVLGIITEDIAANGVGNVIIQGVVKNTSWNWTTVGASLWVNGPSDGTLTETDPNVADAVTYSTKHVPVARVLSPTEIIFEQGLGGVGQTGPQGTVGIVLKATTTYVGTVLLSEDPVNPEAPIAVGDNDTRMTDARTPLAHIHAASTVTFSPYGNLSASDTQAAIQELDDEKLPLAGGTLAGALTLNADPTTELHATTKQYVDGLVSGLLWQDPVHFVNLIDDSLTTAPTLTAADESNVYITAGIGGAWSGFPIGSIVIWDGSSWAADLHEGLLSNHPTGTRFGIAMESTTTPGGTFAGNKNYIYELTNPATPTWNPITPVSDYAVFVNNDESLHAYHQYVYNDYLTKWVEISGAGLVVTASEVDFTPVGNIAATDVQTALAELDTEKSATGHVHGASAITFVPVGGSPEGISATDVQAALAELDTEKALTVHIHGASTITFAPTGNIAATDVQAALAELDTEKALTVHTHVQSDITDLSIPYDLAGQVTGVPDASAIVLRFASVRAFTIASSGHVAKAAIASTGTAVFDIQLNGGSIGTITFTASATGVVAISGSPIAPVSVSIGDVITVVAPGTQDGTLADIGFTLNCNI